jgi:pantetheine-phosphate adenylyltransferase
MTRAIYPGTFDPLTNGHLDIIQRATTIFDEVIVAVARNSAKAPLFSTEERLEMLRDATKSIDKVTIDSFKGLLVEYARSKQATAIIRGLRMISDFEYEFQMALMNRKLADTIVTVFLMPDEKYTYLSSSIIREIAQLGGDCSTLVPKIIEVKLLEKFKK